MAHIVTQNAAQNADQYIGNQMIIPVRIKLLQLGLLNKCAQIMGESDLEIDVVISHLQQYVKILEEHGMSKVVANPTIMSNMQLFQFVSNIYPCLIF